MGGGGCRGERRATLPGDVVRQGGHPWQWLLEACQPRVPQLLCTCRPGRVEQRLVGQNNNNNHEVKNLNPKKTSKPCQCKPCKPQTRSLNSTSSYFEKITTKFQFSSRLGNSKFPQSHQVSQQFSSLLALFQSSRGQDPEPPSNLSKTPVSQQPPKTPAPGTK